MTIQVLVATMNQSDYSILKKLNIKTDAIIGNQCNKNLIEDLEWKGHKIRYLNFNERGVGLNRNNTLMRATADICLFADDDMIYCDDYEQTVCQAFESHPDADIILFNLAEDNPGRYIIRREERIGYFNYLRYGTARMAVKRKSIHESGVLFHLCFGGGTQHSHGEDNIFLADCLKKGLKIYALPIYIAKLTEERKSTWNNGYGKKFLADQGCLYKAISRRWWRFLCLQDAIRHHSIYKRGWMNAYIIMTRGMETRNLKD